MYCAPLIRSTFRGLVIAGIMYYTQLRSEPVYPFGRCVASAAGSSRVRASCPAATWKGGWFSPIHDMLLTAIGNCAFFTHIVWATVLFCNKKEVL